MSEPRGKSSACAQFRYLLPCDLAEVPSARTAVRRFLTEQGLHEEELAACELALAEACNNAIQNVRQDGHSRPVEISVLCTQSKVELTVNDHTEGFDWPDEIDPPDPQCERGRGLFFIQSFMDAAAYFRGKDENCLIMRKMRCHQEHRQAAAAASMEEVQNRLEETQHALSDMARELCFRTESLSAIFRCSAQLGRTNLEQFAQQLLSDLLHITTADWFVLRIVPKTCTDLVRFAASDNAKVPETLSITEAGQHAPSVELQAAVARRDVAFGVSRPLASNDPLSKIHAKAAGIVRPFIAGDTLVGTLTVGKNSADFRFTAAQAKVIHTFADFFGIQVINERLREEQMRSRLTAHELDIARNIQRSLLPKALPELHGFGMAGYCESAREVGGDFYDALQLSDTSVLLVVADVMGKGVPAALFAANLHSLIRALPEWTHQPSELLTRLNWHLYQELSAVDMFITAQVALIDSRKGRMTVASAGHCPVLIAQAGAKIHSISPEGMPLGILPTTKFLDETVDLRSPCRVLLHTDGLTESRSSDGESFGQCRLESWMKKSLTRQRSPEQLRDELAEELRQAQGDSQLKDDQTFLIVSNSELL